ncbi:hypothetical protein VSAK1_00495 [Vibrio mediterranei AK1]|uniref:hypothetical protein n=1 Tax=Vibrio mediterranei TaxID=689 RepID=UPI0001542562|nr:hypothetical protein [Vibrio mediterranei]EDL51097.1 hypothetical protein VSAK1_00495 [Vibrio mediterranei AK1]
MSGKSHSKTVRLQIRMSHFQQLEEVMKEWNCSPTQAINRLIERQYSTLTASSHEAMETINDANKQD